MNSRHGVPPESPRPCDGRSHRCPAPDPHTGSASERTGRKLLADVGELALLLLGEPIVITEVE